MIAGKSVHIVTVNDYLAKSDADWMEPLYCVLGLTVGIVFPRMRTEVERKSYLCDVVYATNNEFGFDYLRNKMAHNLDECLQRELHFAIVDEVDSILIDEARTPLIISGAAEDSSEMYIKINDIVPALIPQMVKEGPGDYSIDEKTRQVYLTEEGHLHVEEFKCREFLLPAKGFTMLGIFRYCIIYRQVCARMPFIRDVDYIVKDDEVIIVDEHTGRLMSVVDGQMGYIKRLKLKKVWIFKMKIKLSQRLLSKISLDFMKSFRA